MRWRQVPEFRMPYDDGKSRRWPWVVAVLAVLFFVFSSAGAFVGLAVVSVVVSCPLTNLQQPNAGRGAGGSAISSEQTQNATAILAEVKREGMPESAGIVAVATAQAESGLRDLPNGDRDSVGLFQQRPSQGWGTPQQLQDPAYATSKFLAALRGLGNWSAMSLEQAAQAVQKSADPAAYANASGLAQQLVGQLWGNTQPGQQSGQSSRQQSSNAGAGFECDFTARPEPQGSPQPQGKPVDSLPIPLPGQIQPPGWKAPIPVPSFPPGLESRVNPPQISPQCVAGALWAWAAMHLADPEFAHPPPLAVPSAFQMTAQAQAEGFRMDTVPQVGDMIVFRQGSFYGPNGHVGVIVQTGGNSVTVLEQNFLSTTDDLSAHWGLWDVRSLAWPDANTSGLIAAPPGG